MFDQSNVPGTGYIAGGPAALAKAAHVPITELTENVPITDASSVALKLVDDAGPDGAVVLNFTPPEALVILQAAQKLGLEDRVKSWGCSTPCDTDFLAKALGPKWDHKLFVNAELTPPDDHNGRRCSSTGRSSPVRLGGVRRDRLLQPVRLRRWRSSSSRRSTRSRAPYTIKSVNAAIKAIKNYKTEMLCKPWTYGNYALHIPNNTDYTVTPDNGKMMTAQGCTAISSADPQIAAVPQGRDGGSGVKHAHRSPAGVVNHTSRSDDQGI